MTPSELIDPTSDLPREYLEHLDAFEKAMRQRDELQAKIRDNQNKKSLDWTDYDAVLFRALNANTAEERSAETGFCFLTPMMIRAAKKHGLSAEPFENMERQRRNLENIGPARDAAKRLKSKLPAAPPTAHGKPTGPAKKMTVKIAIDKAKKYCQRHPFPGVNALADSVGCSPSTMSKAVHGSNFLREMFKERQNGKSVSTVQMTTIAELEPQTREPDPSDAAAQTTDAAFRRLLEQATPEERARLNAMQPAKRLELVATIEHDPDAEEQRKRRRRR
jgi:hypothetical protein